MIWNMLHTVFLQSALFFIVLGCTVSLSVGIAMLVKPRWMEAFSMRANRWFPTSHIADAMNRPRETDLFLQQHRKGFGITILAGSLLALSTLLRYRSQDTVLPGYLGAGGLYWLFIAICAFAGAISLAFLLKPGWFDALESWSNRWHDTEIVASVFDVPRNFLDRFTEQHARLMAVLVIAASLYALVVIVPLLFG